MYFATVDILAFRFLKLPRLGPFGEYQASAGAPELTLRLLHQITNLPISSPVSSMSSRRRVSSGDSPSSVPPPGVIQAVQPVVDSLTFIRRISRSGVRRMARQTRRAFTVQIVRMTHMMNQTTSR